MSMNLLDLPDLVLELIFSYLATDKPKEKSLLSLTECNKYLKNYIATNPKLQKRLILDISLNRNGVLTKRNKAALAACLNSNRKYRSLAVTILRDCEYFTDEIEMLSLEDSSSKLLFEKHATTIKEVKFVFLTQKVDKKFVLGVLQNLDYFSNVEKITVQFKLANPVQDYHEERQCRPKWKDLAFYHDNDCQISTNLCLCENTWEGIMYKYKRPLHVPENISFANQFAHLKKLKLTTESAIVFHIFERCKKLEVLELKFGIADINLTNLWKMIQNSRESLKRLKISSDYNLPINISKIENLIVELQKAEVDLKYFELDLPFLRFGRIELLIEFLKSQKNLENFQYRSIMKNKLLNSFGGILEQLENLKIVNFDLYMADSTSFNHRDRLIWKLDHLEEITFSCYEKYGYKIPRKFFLLPSDRLKKLELKGNVSWWDEKLIFKEITINYQNLVELKIISNTPYEYSSNDIFLILRILKKLKVLKFVFPISSDFNKDLFIDEDLHLPHIENVDLWFNEFITSNDVIRFLQLMSSMSSFRFNAWKDYNEIFFLDIIVKELPNLTDLEFPRCFSGNVDYAVWKKLQMNVDRFCKRSHLFRVYGEKIQHWIKTSAQLRNMNF